MGAGGGDGWAEIQKSLKVEKRNNANEQVTKKGIKRKMLRKQAKLYF